MHTESMANVLIRDLPPEVHDVLVARARTAGQSLQAYLTGELTRLVGVPTVEEVLARIESRQGGAVGLRAAVEELGSERSRRP